MSLNILRRFTITSILLFAGLTTANAENHEASGWKNFIGVYLWGMSINGAASIGSLDAPLDLNFKDDLLENLTGAFSAHYEAKKDKLTLFGDYMYAEIEPKSELPNGAEAIVNFKNKMWELGLAWDLTDSAARTTWQLLGGIRSNKQELRVQVGNPVLVSVNEAWYDGFIGGRVIAPLSEKWQFVGRADVGTGDSDQVFNIVGALDWRFSKRASLLLGYKLMDYNYDNGKRGPEYYAYDARQDGFLTALNFYW